MKAPFAGAALVIAMSALGAGPPGEPGPKLHLRTGSFDPRVEAPRVPERLRLAEPPEAGYFVVQLARPVDGRVLAALRATGAEPLGYLPDQAYLVRLAAGRQERLRALGDVRWLGPVEPAWKLSPDLGRRPYTEARRREQGLHYATIDLFPGEDLAAAAAEVEAAGAQVLRRSAFGLVRRLDVRASIETLEASARIPAVAWIEEAGEVTPRNNSATWVVQTNVTGSRTLWGHGIHGEGQIVGLIDDPPDMGSCFLRDPADNTPRPAHRKVVAYRSEAGLGAIAHGTHVAGIVAGDSSPINGSLDSAGHAYAARISFGAYPDITGSGVEPSNLYAALADAYADGARVHTNSWGDDGTTGYTTWSRDIDLFAYDHEESLVIFAVSNLSTIRTPENANNVLAVGATSNGTFASQWCLGGAGPTDDNRRRPEIMAPGCNIASARDNNPCGTRVLNGTSMAAPAVAGAAALARQYFVEGWYPSGTKQPANSRVPSGALLRATLVNSAADVVTELTYPGARQGFGRVLLEDALYFLGDSRRLLVLADLHNAAGLATGGSDAFVLDVTSSAEPLEITMAFTEPAAALLAADAAVNDLDLEIVSPSGLLYRGNYYDPFQGHSVPGGAADAKNSLENVLVPQPETGTWIVRVEGTAVNEGAQGYALVATGSVQAAPGGTVRYAGHDVDDSTAGDGDGSPEPGETIRVPLELLNLRSTLATNVSGRLYATDPALASSLAGPIGYPDIPAGDTGASESPHFELTLGPQVTCGQALPLHVRASHDAGNTDSSFFFVVGMPPSDEDTDCMPVDCPGDPVPGDVGFTVSVTRSGLSDLLFQWGAVPGASSYRLWRSSVPDFSAAELLLSTTATQFLEVGGRATPDTWYYRVRAVNSCGWEGPWDEP